MPKRDIESVFARLLRALRGARDPLSVRELSRKSGLSWATTDKYLSMIYEFSKAGRLVRTKRSQLTLWSLGDRTLEVRLGKREAEWANELARRMKDMPPQERLRLAFELSDSMLDFHKEVARWRKAELRMLSIE